MTLADELRKRMIIRLFTNSSFVEAWKVWRTETLNILGHRITSNKIVDLGDKLSAIFQSTSGGGRLGSRNINVTVSRSGNAWEGLVNYYLNICLMGTRTVVLKNLKELIPEPISDSLTVNYGNFPCNSESDLIGITFPSLHEFNRKINTLRIKNGIKYRSYPDEVSFKELIDYLADKYFSELEVGIIRCKTNWNENAQIPMLWDMVYSTGTGKNFSVETSKYKITRFKRFTY